MEDGDLPYFSKDNWYCLLKVAVDLFILSKQSYSFAFESLIQFFELCSPYHHCHWVS